MRICNRYTYSCSLQHLDIVDRIANREEIRGREPDLCRECDERSSLADTGCLQVDRISGIDYLNRTIR